MRWAAAAFYMPVLTITTSLLSERSRATTVYRDQRPAPRDNSHETKPLSITPRRPANKGDSESYNKKNKDVHCVGIQSSPSCHWKRLPSPLSKIAKANPSVRARLRLHMQCAAVPQVPSLPRNNVYHTSHRAGRRPLPVFENLPQRLAVNIAGKHPARRPSPLVCHPILVEPGDGAGLVDTRRPLRFASACCRSAVCLGGGTGIIRRHGGRTFWAPAATPWPPRDQPSEPEPSTTPCGGIQCGMFCARRPGDDAGPGRR